MISVNVSAVHASTHVVDKDSGTITMTIGLNAALLPAA